MASNNPHSAYFEIKHERLYIRLHCIEEALDSLESKYKIDKKDMRTIRDRIADKEEEIRIFGEAITDEYKKNKLCQELTSNELFELKTINKLKSSVNKALNPLKGGSTPLVCLRPRKGLIRLRVYYMHRNGYMA